MPTVLIVDDEADLRDALADILAGHGFEVETATTRAEAASRGPGADLVLLDLGLPDGDGIEICTELAAAVALIVISARGGEAERVAALELGADDFLAKPFSPRELVARCRSVLRRGGARPSARVVVGELEVDLAAMTATLAGSPVDLTTKERQLLLALARRHNAVVPREDLAEEVWGASLGAVSRTIDVHMSSLRRKLGDPVREPRFIQTVHGIGFRLLR
ncbi:MAG TPA: response regulator transcription factor [Acidimicrobiales bacterium]|nr:response regulator transcription factor [Acidimicrobiales bacterium]